MKDERALEKPGKDADKIDPQKMFEELKEILTNVPDQSKELSLSSWMCFPSDFEKLKERLRDFMMDLSRLQRQVELISGVVGRTGLNVEDILKNSGKIVAAVNPKKREIHVGILNSWMDGKNENVKLDVMLYNEKFPEGYLYLKYTKQFLTKWSLIWDHPWEDLKDIKFVPVTRVEFKDFVRLCASSSGHKEDFIKRLDAFEYII